MKKRYDAQKKILIGGVVIALVSAVIILALLMQGADRQQEDLLAAPAPQEPVWEISRTDSYVPPSVRGDGVLSLFIDQQGREHVLFERDGSARLPIASVTKLMTSYIAVHYYGLDKEIEITELAAELTGRGKGKLKIGETFSVRALLHPMLIESNNTAALAIANPMGEESFVDLMNHEARLLGLSQTSFVNTTGLDGEEDTFNYSSARDLARFATFLLKRYPLLFEISTLQEAHVNDTQGIYNGNFVNTNELLEEYPAIIGGKTGWTPIQKESLIIVMEAPQERGIIVHILLGTDDRFGEMKKLIDHALTYYHWE